MRRRSPRRGGGGRTAVGGEEARGNECEKEEGSARWQTHISVAFSVLDPGARR